jgi:acyl-[acyl-carrier-protein]-phospholipid O-acyltransferase/long-chain-fatty-acid--[acyl-carrier-protein] ligase
MKPFKPVKPFGSYGHLLKQHSFVLYLLVQFFTAFNDNAFKIVVILLALQAPGQGHGGYVDVYYILAQLVFILPFVLFSGYAGYLADRFPKNQVLMGTKVIEVLIMLLGLYWMDHFNKEMLIVVLFLLSAHSVFFSTAKYGILPEMFQEQDISRVNGMLELLTFLAIILGTAVGGILMHLFAGDLFLIGIVLLIFSIGSGMCSLGIRKVPASGSVVRFSGNPFEEVERGVASVRQIPDLVFSVMGTSYFFGVSLAVTTNLLVFGKELFAMSDLQLGLLNLCLGLGVGVGSIVAGFLSGDKIETGLIPLGGILIGFVA